MVPRVTSIGNTGTPSGEIARAGQVFGGSGDTARGPIGLPGASYEPGSREHLLEMARLWYSGGCSVAPSKPDGSKHPKAQPAGGVPDAQGSYGWGWKRFSTGDLPRLELGVVEGQLRHAADGIGVFCGPPSGELEMLELEGRIVDRLELLAARASERGIEQLWQRLESGCSDWSPSGGLHWYLRTVDGPALGNTKLALRPGADGKPETLAETRGRGGWSVVAGSFGRTHGSGKPYVMRSGSPLTIPGFTCAERDSIHDLFRTLDELPEITRPEQLPREITRRERPEGEILPGDDFDERAKWENVFPSGWEKLSKGETADGWSMHGAGGRKTADHYHGDDSLYIYDTACPGSQRKLSKFSAYAWLQHGGDFRAAAAALYALGYGTRAELRKKKTNKPQPVRIELLEQSPPPFVPLDEWRRELALEVAIEADRPGLKLLRGDPGCGKTYAVARAMAKKSRGVTSAPAHELCGEIVETLRQCGVDAVAYPKLDESTCENYGEAKRAQAAGLSVAACVCSTACPFKDDCRRSGYLALVAAAEKAPHKVVTHERLARSADRLCEKADYLTIEEDPSALLRPSVTGNRKQLERVAELADELAEAGERFWILEGVDLVPQSAPVVEESQLLAEFAEWAPAPGEPTATANREQIHDLKPTNRGGFFERLCSIAEDLSQHCRRAIRDELPDGMHALPLPTVGAIPKNPEGTVWHALETLRRVDGGELLEIKPELRDALTLALNAATGRLDALYLQVDTERDDRKPDDKPRRMARVVGFWRTSLPFDRVPVYVNDGTSDRGLLEQLTGQAVVDITPAGRVALAHPCEHYPVDILPTTSTAKVARILTGIVRAHPDRHRVGLVLLKRHREELLFPEDGEHLLPKDVRERIEWSTYYGAGDDRGSNELHRRCDLAVVLGTFRPPPREVRRKLAQRGRLEAANTAGTWGMVERHAATPAGAETHYAGRGYAEVEWATAADSLTRAAVRQAVGRARAICPTKGVPVVVCTTESVGLPVLEAGALPVAQPRLDVLVEGFSRLPTLPEYRAKNPNSIIRESCAILGQPSATVPELEQVLPDVAPRTLQLWLREAIDAGLVVRSGAARATRYELAPGVVVPAPTLQAISAPLVEAVLVESPPDPVRVVDDPRELDWLEPLLAPERNPITLSDVRWIHEQHVQTLGSWPTWQRECTPPLVRHLHRIAAKEASSRGQPPPPLEMVAGHTVAWHAVTCQVA